MISEEEAVEAARRVAVERGWRWEEPVHVRRVRSFILFGRLTYEVRSNTEVRGGNVRAVVDPQTGTVIEAGYLPR